MNLNLISTFLINLCKLLIPQMCYLCKCSLNPNNSLIICLECEQSLPEIGACCSKCSVPLNGREHLCGHCLNNRRYWSQCYAAFQYKHPIDSLIHQFKYKNRVVLSSTLASFIYNSIENHYEHYPDILTYVPMHHKRLAERGYNHSKLLSKKVSKQLFIPTISLLLKTTDTSSQTTLNSKQRKSEMTNSFEINTSIDKSIYTNKSIAIIDDVVTTGATSSEMAKILLQYGAKEVHIWCIVRA